MGKKRRKQGSHTCRCLHSAQSLPVCASPPFLSLSFCLSLSLLLPAPLLHQCLSVCLPAVQLRAEGPEGCELRLCCPVSPWKGQEPHPQPLKE